MPIHPIQKSKQTRPYLIAGIRILVFCALFSWPRLGSAQTTLVQGDIAFVAYNSDGDIDDFAFMLLKDVTAGTSITFTDHLWQFGTGGFNETYAGTCNTEAFLTWTSSTALSVGAVVVIRNPGPSGSSNPSQATTTTGSVSVPGSCPDFTFPPTGDVLFAYQGTKPTTNSATNWLACINMDGGWLSAASTSTSASAKPGGLNDANVILFSPEVDNVVYKGPLTGSASAIRSAIYNLTNWVSDDVTPYTLPQDIGSTVLPLTWGDFWVREKANVVEFMWTTNSESNTHFFEVEYGLTAGDFRSVRRVSAAGQSSLSRVYEVAIPKQALLPNRGGYLFRIKQVDLDGRFSYSGIRKLMSETKQPIGQLLRSSAAEGRLTCWLGRVGTRIQVYDSQGRLLANQQSTNALVHVAVKAPKGSLLILRLIDKDGQVQTEQLLLQ